MMISVKSMTALGLLAALLLNSCGKKEEELTPAQIQAHADSVLKAKLPKLQQRAREDYEKRLPIELKPKVDSIRKIGNQVGQVPVFPEDDAPSDLPAGIGDTIRNNKDSVKK